MTLTVVRAQESTTAVAWAAGSVIEIRSTAASFTDNLPNVFGTIAVSGQSDVVADSTTDTLTLAAGTNITITTNASTDTITINSSGGAADLSTVFLLMGA